MYTAAAPVKQRQQACPSPSDTPVLHASGPTAAAAAGGDAPRITLGLPSAEPGIPAMRTSHILGGALEIFNRVLGVFYGLAHCLELPEI